jgi:hypothetical protein
MIIVIILAAMGLSIVGAALIGIVIGILSAVGKLSPKTELWIKNIHTKPKQKTIHVYGNPYPYAVYKEKSLEIVKYFLG